MMNKLMIPTVHLNGTSRDELETRLRRAIENLGTAIVAVNETAPHGRDYYTQGHDALKQAMSQYLWRLEALTRVKNELELIYEDLSFQPRVSKNTKTL